MTRSDGRATDQLRPIKFERNWLENAEGSCLVHFGRTRVLCVASVTEGVPRFKKDSGEGWVTAEYAMLPRSTESRSDRESVKGKLGGRTQEISRLVGRSLRAVINNKALGENTIVLDCDVTGAYVALVDALKWAKNKGIIDSVEKVLIDSVAAVSVGVIDGEVRLDLHYEDDVRAQTDMNVVMTGGGKYIEVQGTAEGAPFDKSELDNLLAMAAKGCVELTKLQLEALK